MTKKELKNISAVDITNFNDNDIKKLVEKEKGFDIITTALGTYGTNGALLQGRNSKKLYKITARNSNLFYII